MAGWKERVLDLLFQPKCVFCACAVEHGCICRDCERELLAMEMPPPRTLAQEVVALSALPYEGVVRESLLRFKFEGCEQYARAFGTILARTAALELEGCFDLVTWVPVSRKRRRERGYDQAELLAQALCREWTVKPVRTLVKTAHNNAQSSLSSAQQRQENVRGVYEAFERERFAGKRLLLIDDILTTGSTLAEAARVLRLAGAAEVRALTLAATQRGQ